MTFLHTIFLSVLAAAAIPILLHFFSRQRLPIIQFSSLRFLKRLQKRKTRRIQLRQIILLILRALAVAAIVMAFARPALKSDSNSSSASSTEMAVIIDDALTSSVESRDGQLLRQSVNQALALVDMVGQHDMITIIPTSQPDKFLTTPAGQRDILRSYLREMSPRTIVPHFDDALSVADSLLRSSERFNRELYMIGSFYGSEFDSVTYVPPFEKVRTFLLPIGPAELSNLSVDDITVKSSILQQGKPIEIDVSLHNHSSKAVTESLVSVYLDGNRVAQSTVDLPPDGTVSRTFSIVPDRSGLLDGWIKCEDIDPLTVDSRRYFVLDVPDSLRVFVVAPDSSARWIIRAAFVGDDTKFVRFSWGDSKGWETESLSGFDVLILAGLSSVSSGATQRVAEFAKRGGGVILFPGSDSDLSNLSRGLWHGLGFAGARGTTVQGGISWGKIDFEHPLFTGMFEKKRAPKSPSFKFSVDLSVGSGDQVIIPLSDGRPFLMERKVGRGRALLYATPLELQTGDFIYAGIFAPLLFRSVSYVASQGNGLMTNLETGNNYPTVLPLTRTTNAQLIAPDESWYELLPRPVMGGIEYTLQHLDHPGIYEMMIDERVISKYSANVTTKFSELNRNEFPDNVGFREFVVVEEKAEQLAEIVNSARFGRELWQPIAICFILLLVAESIIGRAVKKK